MAGENEPTPTVAMPPGEVSDVLRILVPLLQAAQPQWPPPGAWAGSVQGPTGADFRPGTSSMPSGEPDRPDRSRFIQPPGPFPTLADRRAAPPPETPPGPSGELDRPPAQVQIQRPPEPPDRPPAMVQAPAGEPPTLPVPSLPGGVPVPTGSRGGPLPMPAMPQAQGGWNFLDALRGAMAGMASVGGLYHAGNPDMMRIHEASMIAQRGRQEQAVLQQAHQAVQPLLQAGQYDDARQYLSSVISTLRDLHLRDNATKLMVTTRVALTPLGTM